MIEIEGGDEGSPTSTDNQVEETEQKPETEFELSPDAPKKGGKVEMINGKKSGAIFTTAGKIKAGGSYFVTETQAKKYEKIPGQRRAK